MSRDVCVSRVYRTNDPEHAMQRVLYGVGFDGTVPYPVVLREDAVTGEVLEEYLVTSSSSQEKEE